MPLSAGTLTVFLAVSVALAGAGWAEAADHDLAHRFTLVGVVLGHRAGPIAVIEDRRTGEDALYRVGHRIEDAAIVAISADRAVLRAGGQDVELRLAASPPPRERPARLTPPRAPRSRDPAVRPGR